MAAFPSHEAIRHLIGHTVDFFYASDAARKRHSITAPWQRIFADGTLQMTGTEPMFVPGHSIGGVYQVTYNGDVHCFD